MSKTVWLCCVLGLWACGCGGSEGADGGRASELHVTLEAVYDAYPHQDAFSGQTAQDVSAGVRSIRLHDDSGGVWELLDAAPDSRKVSYRPGETSSLVALSPEAVRAGHYVKARLVQDWSRFEVTATLHQAGVAEVGTLRVLQATSDQAQVDGQSLAQGFYHHVFVGAEGDHDWDGTLPVPSHSATAEAEAFDEDGEWAVYFPVDVVVPAAASGTLAIRVNLERAFRWSDLQGTGYAAGDYDIAPPLYEPVQQFGGNRFEVSLTR